VGARARRSGPSGPRVVGEWSERVQAYRTAEEDTVRAGDVEAAVEANLRTWLAEGASASVRDRVATMLRRAYELQLPVWDEVNAETLEPPVNTRLSDIRAPTLVVVGSDDVSDFHELGQELYRAISGARHAVIGAAGHAPSMEQPEAFNRLVLAFLQDAALPATPPSSP
jgi:3-oxoadipate enol-lactonase